MSAPPAPADLREDGVALWERITAVWTLDEREVEVLARACRMADLERSLLEGLAGCAIVGEDGKAAPATARLLACQRLLCALLASLDLPGADEQRSQTSIRAGNASAARWRQHNEVAAKRRELRGG
jgi:hypothetical protein